MAAHLLKIQNLTASYDNNIVLHNINFIVESGNNLAILGPNGSGKTTLLRCLAGDVPVTRGSIAYSGHSTASLSPRAIARNIATSDNTTFRPEAFTVLQYVLLGRYPWLSWLGMYCESDYAIAEEALRHCSLVSKMNAPVSTLSSGQWQLAILARTLVQAWSASQPILSLDEITANLDLPNRIEVMQLLESWRSKGAAIIQSIHDCNLAAMFCTHILGIQNGRQLFFGPVEEVFKTEFLDELFNCQFQMVHIPPYSTPQVYLMPPAAPSHTRKGTWPGYLR